MLSWFTVSSTSRITGELIRRTDFYVNVSKAEGLCIPLMEFMSCGKPALAPRHTSLLDYLDDANSIAIEATPSLASGPMTSARCCAPCNTG